jgi:hypothetical protein
MAPLAQAVQGPAALAETVILQEVAAVVEETATRPEAVVVAAAEETATQREAAVVAEETATRREVAVEEVGATGILPAEAAGTTGVTVVFRAVARTTRAGAATIRRPTTSRLVRCRNRGP